MGLILHREKEEKVTEEKRYYISSLSPNAEEHAKAVRNHWGIKNKQHWILNVGFNEDKCRIRDKVSGKNFATLRRLVLNEARKKFGRDEKYLKKVIGEF